MQVIFNFDFILFGGGVVLNRNKPCSGIPGRDSKGKEVRSSEKMVTFAENDPTWNSSKPTKNSCASH